MSQSPNAENHNIYLQKKNLSIVIPTKNSGNHIDIILKYYIDNDIKVNVFVDDSTTDQTYDICRELAHRTELISNPSGRAEGMIQTISEACETDWILRFDDDELPSKIMMDYAFERANEGRETLYAFRIVQCCLSHQNRLLALREFERPPHNQKRLFNRRFVSFSDKIHTPGFEVDQEEICSPDYFFVHLQWIIKNYSERLEKIASYDSQEANAGSRWSFYYLVEDNKTALETAYPIDNLEFTDVAKALSMRFPNGLRARPHRS